MSSAFVLPGEYQVSLQVGGKEMMKPVEVAGDPRIAIAFEDRKSQHDAIYTIYQLMPLMSKASRSTDKIRKEIGALQSELKKVPDLPEGINEAVKNVKDKIGDIRQRLLGDPEAGYRGMLDSVRGRLLMLYRSIGSYTGAPTGAQIQQIDEDSKALEAIVLEINRIIATNIAELNKMLNENDVPRLFVGDPIKF